MLESRHRTLKTTQAISSAKMDPEVTGLTAGIPVDQIPGVILFLAAQLLEEGCVSSVCEVGLKNATDLNKFLTMGKLAERLGMANR